MPTAWVSFDQNRAAAVAVAVVPFVAGVEATNGGGGGGCAKVSIDLTRWPTDAAAVDGCDGGGGRASGDPFRDLYGETVNDACLVDSDCGRDDDVASGGCGGRHSPSLTGGRLKKKKPWLCCSCWLLAWKYWPRWLWSLFLLVERAFIDNSV